MKNKDRYPENWEKIALEIKEQAEWTCHKCGLECFPPNYLKHFVKDKSEKAKLTLTVHHSDYDRSNNHPSNLIPYLLKQLDKAQSIKDFNQIIEQLLTVGIDPMNKSDIRIKRETYEELIKHLEVHSATDEWARTLLKRLQTEAKPAYILDSGTYILDSKNEAEYRVN